MKHLLIILLITLSLQSFGQSVTHHPGSSLQLDIWNGSIQYRRAWFPPMSFNPYSTHDSVGMLAFDSAYTQTWVYQIRSRKDTIASRYWVDSVIAASGSSFDTTHIYAALADSMQICRDSFLDIRTDLAGKQPLGTYLVPGDTANKWVPIGDSTDLTGYATNYGVDTAKGNLRTEISAAAANLTDTYIGVGQPDGKLGGSPQFVYDSANGAFYAGLGGTNFLLGNADATFLDAYLGDIDNNGNKRFHGFVWQVHDDPSIGYTVLQSGFHTYLDVESPTNGIGSAYQFFGDMQGRTAVLSLGTNKANPKPDAVLGWDGVQNGTKLTISDTTKKITATADTFIAAHVSKADTFVGKIAATNVYPSPGTGTVTTVTANALSPIFTSSTANNTTTPAISYTLSNAGAHAFLGNNTSVSATPAYVQPAFTDLGGNISTSQMNSGTNASSSTFFRGDGTWSSAVQSIASSGSPTAYITGAGSTAENNGTDIVIPANAISANGCLIIYLDYDFVGTAGIKTVVIRAGTNANSITDPQIQSNATVSNALYYGIENLRICNQGATNSQLWKPSPIGGQGAVARVSTSIDTTNPWRIHLNGILANSGDKWRVGTYITTVAIP